MFSSCCTTSGLLPKGDPVRGACAHHEAARLAGQEQALVLVGVALPARPGDCTLSWRSHVDPSCMQKRWSGLGLRRLAAKTYVIMSPARAENLHNSCDKSHRGIKHVTLPASPASMQGMLCMSNVQLKDCAPVTGRGFDPEEGALFLAGPLFLGPALLALPLDTCGFGVLGLRCLPGLAALAFGWQPLSVHAWQNQSPCVRIAPSQQQIIAGCFSCTGSGLAHLSTCPALGWLTWKLVHAWTNLWPFTCYSCIVATSQKHQSV